MESVLSEPKKPKTHRRTSEAWERIEEVLKKAAAERETFSQLRNALQLNTVQAVSQTINEWTVRHARPRFIDGTLVSKRTHDFLRRYVSEVLPQSGGDPTPLIRLLVSCIYRHPENKQKFRVFARTAAEILAFLCGLPNPQSIRDRFDD